MDLQNNENSGVNAVRSGKLDLKIVAGLIIVAFLLIYFLFRFFFFVSGPSVNIYDKTLSVYYLALAKNDTNMIAKTVTADFVDELEALKLNPGHYEVFPYRYEKLDSAEDISTETISNKGKINKITYSLSYQEDKIKVSCLLESYMILKNGHSRIQYIKKLYKGKNIAQ